MNTITNLQDVPIDKIETDIMSVLYANMDTKFSQFALFNKVLEDKYDGQFSSQIHPNFKSRFLLVLKNLMSKYDDIKVKKENEIYNVMCLSDSSNTIEIKNYQNKAKQPVSLDQTDYANMFTFIYDNNPSEFVTWTDPLDSNSIYHELVLSQNKYLIEKLLAQNEFNFLVKNAEGKTPIELATSQEITNLMSIHLLQKVITLTETNKLLEETNKTNSNDYENTIKFLKSDDNTNKIIVNTPLKNIIGKKISVFFKKHQMNILSKLLVICLVIMVYSVYLSMSYFNNGKYLNMTLILSCYYLIYCISLISINRHFLI